MARRIFWLGTAIVAAIALYTGAWFYAADRLAQEVRAGLASFSRGGGNRAVCEEPTVRGYPFRIGLFCDATYFERAAAGFSMSTGAFRSAAQIYAPRRALAEIDSPARVLLPGLVPLDLTWEGMRTSTRLASPLPERLSIEGKKLTAVADMPNVAGPLAFAADTLELHMRPADPNVDIAVRFGAFEPGRLLLAEGELPPLTGYADLTLVDGIAMLDNGGRAVRGISLDIRRIEISSPDGARLTATGTAAIGEDGLIDADLTLGTTDAAALARVVSAAFPEGGNGLAPAIAALAALGPNPELPLVIENGNARLGFINLGTIPPLTD
jgi:hypothetical protein